jgi:hypothetical protein
LPASKSKFIRCQLLEEKYSHCQLLKEKGGHCQLLKRYSFVASFVKEKTAVASFSEKVYSLPASKIKGSKRQSLPASERMFIHCQLLKGRVFGSRCQLLFVTYSMASHCQLLKESGAPVRSPNKGSSLTSLFLSHLKFASFPLSLLRMLQP